MNVTPVFKRNYELLRVPKKEIKYIVNQGGTSSGKTFAILQLLFCVAIETSGLIITVAGQDIPNLKKGAIRDAKKIVSDNDWIQGEIEAYNSTDRTYTFANGSIIEFSSFSDEQDAKSGKRDYLFINEANGISFQVVWQLMIRTRQKVFIDYNPTSSFWVHEQMLPRLNVALVISDHRHNTFLSDEQHKEIEGIEDKELFDVYARGRTGKIQGLIYRNYEYIDAIPAHLKRSYGVDFGFNHKTAVIETAQENNLIFSNEIIYQSEITTAELIGLLKESGVNPKANFYCDSARPDAIKELRMAGFNALQADKDVMAGINYIKKYTHFITRSSLNLIKEIKSYKWKVKGDTMIDEPVKFFDDAIDAMRYGHYTARKTQNKVQISAPTEKSYLDFL